MSSASTSSLDNSNLASSRAMRTAAVAAIVLLAVMLPLRASAQAPRFNVTGVWEGNFWGGADFRLTQEGDRAWGKFTYGNGGGFARGNWNDGRLILILTPTTAQVGGACDSRKVLTSAISRRIFGRLHRVVRFR